MFRKNYHLTNKVSNTVKVKRTVGNTLAYILLIVISIIWIFPFFYLVLQSLRGESTNPVSYLIPQEFTFDNYIQLFQMTGTDPFMKWYLNTLMIAVISCVFQTILTLMTAYCLSRMRFKGRQGIMKIILIVGMFPSFLSMIAIYQILNLFEMVGNPAGLILVYIAGSAGGYYIVKGFLDTGSRSRDEAAMIDGATRNTIFWKIILPLSKPIIIYTILISFTSPWGDYMMSSYLLGTNSENWTVAIGLRYWLTGNNGQAINTYFTRFCAGAVFTSIPIVVLFFFLQRYYVEGVTGGAVKG